MTGAPEFDGVMRSRAKFAITKDAPRSHAVWQCAECRERVVASVSPGVCEVCDGDMVMAPQQRKASA